MPFPLHRDVGSIAATCAFHVNVFHHRDTTHIDQGAYASEDCRVEPLPESRNGFLLNAFSANYQEDR
jgi:hypothetical protein